MPHRPHLYRDLGIFTAAMVAIVTASNVLVQFPINDWLTWAAFTYPCTFLVTDLTNRRLGAANARKVVYAGFAVAIVLSALVAAPRIAVASATAFLVAQLLDIAVFDRLRNRVWWLPPLASSTLGSLIDTLLFFAIAFAGTGVPWQTLALGDFAVKLALSFVFLAPYRALLKLTAPEALRPATGPARPS